MSDLAQAKEAKIASARTLANWAIEAQYPSYKQLNISRLAAGYTLLDQAAMARTIDAVRAQCDDYETSVDEAQTVEAVNAITINYEAKQ